jgi:hypothetical protein
MSFAPKRKKPAASAKVIVVLLTKACVITALTVETCTIPCRGQETGMWLTPQPQAEDGSSDDEVTTADAPEPSQDAPAQGTTPPATLHTFHHSAPSRQQNGGQRWRIWISQQSLKDAQRATDRFTAVNSTKTSKLATMCIRWSIGNLSWKPEREIRRGCKSLSTPPRHLRKPCAVQCGAFNGIISSMSHLDVLNIKTPKMYTVFQLLRGPKIDFWEKLFSVTNRAVVW